MKERKQSTTTYPICFFMTSSTDHITGITGITPTVTIRKSGGSFASPSGAVTEIANGWYQLAGNATDRDTLGELLLHATGTGCDPTDDKYVIVPYDPFDGAYYGLTGIDDLETRLTAARAGYLDELAAANLPTDIQNVYDRIGAPAGASIAADLVVIDNFVDDLETRLTAARAGYLDYLNTRLVGTIAAGTHNPQSGDTYARLGAPAGASIAADLVVIDNFVDDLESRLTAARAGYLDELGAGNIPADVDTLLTRLSALRAGYLDNLSGGAVALASGVVVSDKTGFSLSTAGVDDILDDVVEGTVTLRQAMRLVLAVLTGESSGGGTTTLTFRDIGDTKNRLVVTVDLDGNRTAVGTRDGS